MEISDYDKYYQKGGSYILPIEVFNELWGEMESWKSTSKEQSTSISNFNSYLDDLYDSFKNTPADNMAQETQRASCLVLVENIKKKFVELTQKD